MPKQFLLNADGSIPANTNVALLEAEGIPLVLPTPRWRPSEDMVLQEADPIQVDGVWRQVWVEVIAPEPEFESAEDI